MTPERSEREPGAQRWKAAPELWDKLKPLAREMRTEPTPAENALWQTLRDRQLAGKKFRRQHAIERFVVDFYCSEARLAIEVDGEFHQYTREQDAARQSFLEQQGLLVLRFTNSEIHNNLADVLAAISAQAETRSAKTPLSAGRRGVGGEVSMTQPFSITSGGRTAMLTCHTGMLTGRRRRNSRAAVRECLDAGVARIEIDIHSLDGPDYIVSHERRLERETTGSGSIGSATPDAVRAARFLDDPDDRPALLSEIVEMVRDSRTHLQLDFKDWRLLRDDRLHVLLDLIEPIKQQVIVSAGEDWNLRLLHSADPELAIGFDPGRYIGWSHDGEPDFLPRTRGAYGYFDDNPLAIGRTETTAGYLRARMEAFAFQCPASCEMFLDHRLILQMLDDSFNPAAWLHEHDSEVTTWTVDYTGAGSMRIAERLIAAGVDRITTNTPLAWTEAFGPSAK